MFDKKKELIALHKSRKSIRACADELGISPTWARLLLKAEGIDTSYRTTVDVKKAFALRSKGLTYKEIAKKLGCGERNLYKQMAKAREE